MKEGIKEILDVLALAEKTCDGVIASCADGRLDWRDAAHAFEPLKAAVEAVRGHDKIPAELADLDSAEITRIVERSLGLADKVSDAAAALAKVKTA